MPTGDDSAPSPGRGRSLARPAFADDDGTADPGVRALLAVGDTALGRALRRARLLGAVVAVADEVGADGADKESHMAVVSMISATGERGLLAFTGGDSLAAWDPAARPVPALGRDVARSALADGCSAVVVDVAGPVRAVLRGRDLHALADDLDLTAVDAAVRGLLAGLPLGDARVRDVRAESDAVDVLVEMPSPALAEEAARRLAGAAALADLVPGGLGVVGG